MRINKTILTSIILILILPLISATHDLTIPNYLDVNVTENILITSNEDTTNQSAYIILNGLAYNFSHAGDSFSINVLSTTEQDLPYKIIISNMTYGYYSFNDGSNETTQTISNTTYYYGIANTQINETHLAGKIETHILCAYMKKNTVQNPNIQVASWYNNGTAWRESLSPNYTVTNTNYSFNCYDAPQYYNDTMINFTEYIAFKCVDCAMGVKTLNLGIDTNGTIYNKSIYARNYSNITNITTQNYLINYYDQDDIPIEEYNGLLLFRIPYYVNITIYNTRNTTLDTKFDYIYLRRNGNIQTYANMGKAFTNVFGWFISSSNIEADYTETFWAEVDTNTARIKLYENGTYNMNLLTMKTFMPGVWSYEFIKPQYTQSQVNTQIDSAVTFENETNSNVRVLLTEYEANKSDFVFNILKWIFIIAILVLGMYISFNSPAPMYGIGGIFIIILVLIKILGVHI